MLILIIMLLLAVGCRPPVDGCNPGEFRCSPGGVPQVCSSSRRWTNGDRPCGELSSSNGAVICCEVVSPFTNRKIRACLPESRCVAGDGGVE